MLKIKNIKMKNKLILLAFLLTGLFIGCEDDDYEAPNSFSDVGWYTSLLRDAEFNIGINDFITFSDLSQGAIEHSWTIADGSFYLKSPLTKNDTIYEDFIIDPNLKISLLSIANCYGEIEMYNESIKSYEKYLTHHPTSIDANYYYSQIKLKTGQFEDKIFLNFDNRFFISERATKQYYNINHKLWSGNYVDKLVVWSEQGIGDHLFFSKHL